MARPELPRIRDVFSSLLDLLLPPACVVCGALLDDADDTVCPACREGFEPLTGPLCAICGQPYAGEGPCPDCRSLPPATQGVRSAFVFGGPLAEAIHRLKYGGQRRLAPFLANLLFSSGAWDFATDPVDLLVPVPLYPGRLSRRGFNQSLLIARELSRLSHVAIDFEHLARVRDTASQSEMKTRKQRRQNVDGAFGLVKGHPFRSKRILLIDDVVTTGATISACARALAGAQVASVCALTVARTSRWQEM